MPTLRVSAAPSRPHAVAGAVAALLHNEGRAERQAIGPHALKQARKSSASERTPLRDTGQAITLTDERR